jgi:hypothetical protein
MVQDVPDGNEHLVGLHRKTLRFDGTLTYHKRDIRLFACLDISVGSPFVISTIILYIHTSI